MLFCQSAAFWISDEIVETVKARIAERSAAPATAAEQPSSASPGRLDALLRNRRLVVVVAVVGVLVLVGVIGALLWPRIQETLGQTIGGPTPTAAVTAAVLTKLDFGPLTSKTITVGQSTELTLRALDDGGNPLEGQTITLAVDPLSAGRVEPREIAPDPDGIAMFSVTADTPGTLTVIATAGDVEQTLPLVAQPATPPLALRPNLDATPPCNVGDGCELKFLIDGAETTVANVVFYLRLPDGLEIASDKLNSRCGVVEKGVVRCELGNVSQENDPIVIAYTAQEALEATLNSGDYWLEADGGSRVDGAEAVEIVVAAPPPSVLATLTLEPANVELPADGQTAQIFTINASDQHGEPYTAPLAITVSLRDTDATPEEAVADERLEIPCQLTESNWFLRSEPGDTAQTVASLTDDTPMTAIANDGNGWLYVEAMVGQEPVAGWLSAYQQNQLVVDCDEGVALESLPAAPPDNYGRAEPAEVSLTDGTGKFTYVAGVTPGPVTIEVRPSEMSENTASGKVTIILLEIDTLSKNARHIYAEAEDGAVGGGDGILINRLPFGTTVELLEIDSATSSAFPRARHIAVRLWVPRINVGESEDGGYMLTNMSGVRGLVDKDSSSSIDSNAQSDQLFTKSLADNYPVELLEKDESAGLARVRLLAWVRDDQLTSADQ